MSGVCGNCGEMLECERCRGYSPSRSNDLLALLSYIDDQLSRLNTKIRSNVKPCWENNQIPALVSQILAEMIKVKK